MKALSRKTTLALAAVALALGGMTLAVRAAQDAPAASAAAKAALTVTVVTAKKERWPLTVSANGSVAAWQEALIGAEAQGLRLVDLRAQVGDRVAKGAVLALLQSDTLGADLAVSRASLAEAEAALAEAQTNAERARQLQPSGALSSQQIQQYLTAEMAAQARVASAKARLSADQVRLAQTRILAPDAGIISARSATLGMVVSPGTELFRLIRQGRLEWRAELPAADLARVRPGTPAELQLPEGRTLQGKVRVVAPTVDAGTRNGLVYVDLPQPGEARPGTYVRGHFAFGDEPAVTLPQAALVVRDGFSYLLQVLPDERVRQLKVEVGRRRGDRVEIRSPLPADARFVAQGGGFLADGDRVRVVAAPLAAAAASR